METFSKLYDNLIKNSKFRILFFIILTLLSSISLFTISLKYGHDILFHLSRIVGIKDSFSNDLFPSIYSNYLNGYGYGNPLFYPDIFLYVPAFINYLGLSINTSYKIFIILVNFFSIISMYITVKGISKSKYAGIISSIIYAFASYRLIDVFSRAALGEALAFIFIPLIIYGIYNIIYGDYKKFYILVIGMSGLILSHILSTYIICILLFIFCLINIKKFIKEKQRIKYLVISALITLLITAFFIFPMLEQMISGKFLFNNTAKISEITKRSVPIYALFLEIILPLKYWIPAGIGIIFIYLTYLKIKNRNIKDSFITQCFIIGVVCLFLASNIFPWKLFEKAFSLIQFPWRLYVITTVLLTVGGGILISKIYTKNKDRIKQLIIVFSLSLISLISITVTTLLSGNTNLNNYYISMGEYLPSDVNLDYIKERGNVVTSNNQITFTHKKVDNKIIIDFVNNYDNTILELPLLYYKGYGAKINDEYLDVFKTNNGLVGVKLNNIKEGTLEVSYIKTPTIYISRGISLLSVTIFGLYLYMKGRKKDEKQKNI